MRGENMKRITLKAVLLLLCIVTVLSAVTVTNASSSDQTVTLSLEGQVQNDEKSVTVSVTDGGLMISPSVDVNGQIASIVYTQEECEKAMKSLAACGFERVYFVVSHAGIPAGSSGANGWNEPDGYTHLIESVMAMGDPNFAFLYACHKAGMEAIAVYKPYEMGGNQTIPFDVQTAYTLYSEKTVGGNAIQFNAFLSENPEMRLERKPNEAEKALTNATIAKIDAAFILDEFTTQNWGFVERKTTHAAISNENANRTGIKLYVSKNNADYVEYSGEYSVEYTIENRKYLDENGWEIFEGDTRCLVATVSGISITEEYTCFALVLDSNSGLYTIPQSMVNAYTEQGEVIPVTSSQYSRAPRSKAAYAQRPDDYIWGDEGEAVKLTSADNKLMFTEYGFEFDWMGIGFSYDAFINCYSYGFARGKFEYAKGTPCEAYEEVREYWLSTVEYLLAMGYDGIDIRLQNHSGMISDYSSYGFNKPIVEKYLEKYGVDILALEEVTPEVTENIMRIRGEYFMEFLAEASALVRGQGKTMMMHMRMSIVSPRLESAHNEIAFWAMPRIIYDWKAAVDLCDEITVKDYWNGSYDASVGMELKQYVHDSGKKLWMMCYVSSNEMNFDFVSSFENDPYVDGVVLYEYDPTGATFIPTASELLSNLGYD